MNVLRDLNDVIIPDNIEEICRTCLSHSGKRQSIFSVDRDSDICFKLYSISQIQVTVDDGLPSIICEFCLNYINQTFSFIQKIKTADEILKNHIWKIKNNKICNLSDDNILPEKIIKKKPKNENKNNSIKTGTAEKLSNSTLGEKTKIKFENYLINNDNNIINLCICPLCAEKFNLESSLNKHLKELHKINKPFTCDYCCLSYATKKPLEVHILSKHINKKEFTCDICFKIFSERRYFNRHKLIHISQFPCEICEKCFNTQQSLNIHKHTHERKIELPCSQCKMVFFGEYQLQRHTKLAHTGETHECDRCHKVFSHITRLRKHLLCHMDVKAKRLQCGYCPKRFHYYHHLRNHERIHTGSKPFLCTKCGQGFAQSHNLTLHLRKHEEVLPYVCEICNKSFANTQRLKRHTLTHSDEKPFMCNVCGKCYNDEATLRKHIISHNTKQNNTEKNEQNNDLKDDNLSCKVCKKKFDTLNKLKNHTKSHLKHKNIKSNHVCEECGIVYSLHGHLINHMKQMHSKEETILSNNYTKCINELNKPKIASNRSLDKKEIICSICKKGFASSKSLNAHMRAHTTDICIGKRNYENLKNKQETKHTSKLDESSMKEGLQNGMENVSYSQSNNNTKNIIIMNDNNEFSIQNYELLQNYELTSLLNSNHSLQSSVIIHNQSHIINNSNIKNEATQESVNIIVSDNNIVTNTQLLRKNYSNTIRLQHGKYLLQLSENLQLALNDKIKIEQTLTGNEITNNEHNLMLDFTKINKKFESNSVELNNKNEVCNNINIKDSQNVSVKNSKSDYAITSTLMYASPASAHPSKTIINVVPNTKDP